MERLDHILKNISPLDPKLVGKGVAYCDSLAKPLGSLGKMEKIYARLFAMFNGRIDIERQLVMVYVADNGVVDEGVSKNPQETTHIVAKNMLQGKSGLCAISKHVGSKVKVIDIGCQKDIYQDSQLKIKRGTANIARGPAMTRQEAIEAILRAYDVTVSCIKEGYTLFGTGEMGIGNTTTSAAIISTMLDIDPSKVTGYGAGLSDEMKQHKTDVIVKAIEINVPFTDTLDIASKIGGLDILGMVGTYLACANYRLPCVVDGLISITALLIASDLNKNVLDYCFASHISQEPGYQIVCRYLELEPMLQMDMRLGEGSGCPLAFFLISNSVYTMESMPTFEKGNLSKSDYIDIRK